MNNKTNRRTFMGAVAGAVGCLFVAKAGSGSEWVGPGVTITESYCIDGVWYTDDELERLSSGCIGQQSGKTRVAT